MMYSIINENQLQRFRKDLIEVGSYLRYNINNMVYIEHLLKELDEFIKSENYNLDFCLSRQDVNLIKSVKKEFSEKIFNILFIPNFAIKKKKVGNYYGKRFIIYRTNN